MRILPVRTPVAALVLASAMFFAPAARLFAQAAPVAAAQASPASLQGNRVAGTVSLGDRLQVGGHIPAWIKSKATDVGPLPESQNIQLVFSVSRAPAIQAAFDQLLLDQQNTASPRYHQWLTPLEVGRQYGATEHDLDALTTWLTSQGFTLDAVSPSRTSVQVTAPVALVNSALGTSLHSYATVAGTVRAPLTEPSIPAALAAIVPYIDGLTTIPRTTYNRLGAPQPIKSAGSAKPLFTASTGAHFLLPGDFNTIYNVKAAATAGYTGSGYKVAIIGGSRLLAADVTNYEGLAALPSYQPNIVIGPNFTDPGYSTSDQTEGMLDFERVYGTAPGAQVDMVIAKNWLDGTTTTNLLVYAINTVNDPVLSLSFGACEALQSASYVTYENNLFQQAASQGISVMVSSGDSGVAGCDGLTTANTNYASINDICATSYVTCVGGTEFNDATTPSSYWSANNNSDYSSALTYIPEGAWNEPSYVGSNNSTVYQAAGTGGGFSTNIAKPSYQTGTGVPADGQRDTPDVSFSAAGHDGYILCQSAAGVTASNPSGFDCVKYIGVVAGTSAAAPSMAGIAAILDQRLGGRQGNLNPLLYKLFNSAPAVFHDSTPASSGVTSCSTAVPSMCNNTVTANPTTSTAAGSATPVVTGYALTTGYDLATGLGSLDVNAFINTAYSGTVTTTTLTATPSSITTAQTVKFSATVASGSGTPTGTVQFASNGVALGSPVTIANNLATTPALSFTTAGTYAITAVYSGDTNFAGSAAATLSFVVTAPALPATNTGLTIAPATTTAQGSVTATATVSSTTAGTPTGSVQFLRNLGGASVSLGSGTVTAGRATVNATNQPAGNFTITAVYSGDANYSTSTSPAVSFTVSPLATSTSVSVNPTTGNTLTSFTPTATIAFTPNTISPTGTVQFYVDGNARGTTVTVSGATAVGAPFPFAAGTHSVTAVYSGDSYFGPSTSPGVSVVVVQAPFFTIVPTSTSLTATSGSSQSVTDILTPTSTNGFAGNITYACSVAFTSGTASVNPGCTISPLTVAFPATSTLTISTIAPHTTKPVGVSLSMRRLGTGSIAFAGLFFCLLPSVRRRRMWSALALFVFASATLAGLSGCGSGGAPLQTIPTGGTTTGSYIVTVTGTTTTGITPATININLTVN